MPKRPSLSDVSFLGHIFSPKKNPQPSGLRKVTLKGTKGGRSKGRLNSFNRMSPVNQEMLKRAGMRDQYLKGEVSLADAKRALRPRGVQLGVAKPTKGQGIPARSALDIRVAAHLKAVVRREGRPVNEFTVDKNVQYIPSDDMQDVLTWDYAQVKAAGGSESPYNTVIDGHQRNPFWYH